MTGTAWVYPEQTINPAPIVEVEGAWDRLIVRPVEYSRGYKSHAHRHRYGQIIYALSGLMTVKSPDGIWMIPAGRAAWVPPLQEHSVEFLSDTEMRSLFIDSKYAADLPTRCRVVTVSPLLKELAIYVASAESSASTDIEEHIVSLISHLLEAALVEPLEVPIPSNPKLRLIYHRLINDPADHRTIEQWGDEIGLGGRTLIRKLKDETGQSFRLWRQQIRLLASLDMIARGEPITTIALEVGYSTPSAYTVAFKDCFGVTPSSYFR